jgi:serine/threonine-protein kinase
MTPVASPRSQSRRPKGLLTGWLPYDSLRRKIAFRVILPLIVLIVLVVIVNGIVMPIITRHGSEFPLPDFTGERLLEARMALKDLSLVDTVASEEYTDNVDKGVILNQFPLPGTKVKGGRQVKFVVSLGQRQVPVPEVAGLSVRQARLDLETVGLRLGEIAWAFSDTLPERVVVMSYPPVGTEVETGSEITLFVNRGRVPRFTYVPGVVGEDLTEAKRLLLGKDLKLGIVSYRIVDSLLPETVLEQSEPEGAEVDIGTEIDLVVSAVE